VNLAKARDCKSIDEAAGTYYTGRNPGEIGESSQGVNSLCLAFYTVCQRRIKLDNHCWVYNDRKL
jgi:hypothetical protein